MSVKGGRQNLGTVVELSETGDDCTSPLLITTTSADPHIDSQIPADASIVEPSDTKEDDIHSVAQVQRSSSHDQTDKSMEQSSSQPQPNRRRFGPFWQTRTNLVNLLHNIGAPIRVPRSGNSRTRETAATISLTKSNNTNLRSSDDHVDSPTEGTFPVSSSEDLDWSRLTSSRHSFRRLASTTSASGSGDSSNNMDHSAPVSSQAIASKKMRDCPLCYFRQQSSNFPRLTNCSHRSCRTCLARYLSVEIMESRVNISCPECSEPMHQNDIYNILSRSPQLIEKYENFALRRVLMTDPDTRWCPAPDCTYAVVATSCAACPQLKCERPGCNTLFCYHCKGIWHNNQTCDEARRERAARLPSMVDGSGAGGNALNMAPFLVDRESFLKPGDVKACPRCRTLIVKMNDGSCNHMVCAMCGAEFCWLCLKVITDLHYLSPTGCTFWGKRPWTRKKKLLWQIGTLIGAPVGIALIAGLAVPGIIFGVPVFVGRKAYQRFAYLSMGRRRLITAASVAGSLIVSPVLAIMAVGVGVPIMLAYVYGVVPLSLCRNGGCGGGEGSTETPYGEEDDEIAHLTGLFGNTASERSRLIGDRADGTSVKTGVSINSGMSSDVGNLPISSGSRSGANGGNNCRIHVHSEHSRRRPSVESGVTSLGEKVNFDGASVNAMAGSRYDNKSVHTVYSDGQEAYDEAGSTKALAGSVLDSKSLTDSACGRATALREREMSPASVTEDVAKNSSEDCLSCSSKTRMRMADVKNKSKASSSSQNVVGFEDYQGSDFYCTEGPSSATVARHSASSDTEDQFDPYKVHALMDNLKQILNDEIAEEMKNGKTVSKGFWKNPNHHSKSYTRPATRSYSNKSHSGMAVSAHFADEYQVVITANTSGSPNIRIDVEDARSRSSSAPSSNLPRYSPVEERSSSESEDSPRKRSFFGRLFRRKRS